MDQPVKLREAVREELSAWHRVVPGLEDLVRSAQDVVDHASERFRLALTVED